MDNFNATLNEMVEMLVREATQSHLKRLVDFLDSTDDLLDGNYSGFYSEGKNTKSKNTWIISVEKKES